MLISERETIVLTVLVRPRHFLLLGGTVLVILGLAGVAGLLRSISQASAPHPRFVQGFSSCNLRLQPSFPTRPH